MGGRPAAVWGVPSPAFFSRASHMYLSDADSARSTSEWWFFTQGLDGSCAQVAVKGCDKYTQPHAHIILGAQHERVRSMSGRWFFMRGLADPAHRGARTQKGLSGGL